MLFFFLALLNLMLKAIQNCLVLNLSMTCLNLPKIGQSEIISRPVALLLRIVKEITARMPPSQGSLFLCGINLIVLLLFISLQAQLDSSLTKHVCQNGILSSDLRTVTKHIRLHSFLWHLVFTKGHSDRNFCRPVPVLVVWALPDKVRR